MKLDHSPIDRDVIADQLRHFPEIRLRMLARLAGLNGLDLDMELSNLPYGQKMMLEGFGFIDSADIGSVQLKWTPLAALEIAANMAADVTLDDSYHPFE